MNMTAQEILDSDLVFLEIKVIKKNLDRIRIQKESKSGEVRRIAEREEKQEKEKLNVLKKSHPEYFF